MVVFMQEGSQVVAPDYSFLRDLLAEGKWQQADTETMNIILKIAGRTVEGYPKPSDIKQIPTADLQEIDSLWGRYSQGKFGFTPQKWIWIKASHNYTEFCELIHWHQGDTWLDYRDINFNINAVVGHLPALMFPYPVGDTEVISFALGSWRVALLNR